MAAPNVASTATTDTAAGTSHVLTLPANVAAGDLVLLMVAVRTATLATPAGWSQPFGPLMETTGCTLYVFALEATGSPGASVTVTSSGECVASAIAYRYDGSAGSLAVVTIEHEWATRLDTPSPDAPALTLDTVADTSWGACAWTSHPYPADAWPLAGDNVTDSTVFHGTQTSIAACTTDTNADSEDPGAFHWQYSGSPTDSGVMTWSVRFGTHFSPPPFGTEVGFAASIAFAPSGPVLLLPHRFGTEVGFTPGLRLTVGGARQVMLTGGGIETPEMTEGGTEGQVLTFHAGSVPSWEDGGSGPGAMALDDLTDVNAPTPSDGNVLAWDDVAGEWAPVAPGTPDLSAASIDDLGDVNTPGPTNGDVLTWDSTPGAWVPAAPATPPESTPPALRVYLYSTFK